MFHVNQLSPCCRVSRESFADAEAEEEAVQHGFGVDAAEQPLERLRGAAASASAASSSSAVGCGRCPSASMAPRQRLHGPARG